MVSLITIHGGALLFDVNGIHYFASVPLLLSAWHLDVAHGRGVFTISSGFVPVQVLSELDPEGPLRLANVRVDWVVVTCDVIDSPKLVLQGSLVLGVCKLECSVLAGL